MNNTYFMVLSGVLALGCVEKVYSAPSTLSIPVDTEEGQYGVIKFRDGDILCYKYLGHGISCLYLPEKGKK